MIKMHSLLKRQLRHYFKNPYSVTGDLSGFIEDINKAYFQSDDDRNMLERSLDLSSNELLQANSELNSIFQAFPDLFFRLDRTGMILDFKGGRAMDLYMQPERLIGKHIYDIPLKNVKEKFLEAIQEVLRSNAMVSIEYSIKNDKLENHYEARLLPALDGQIIAVIRNMTEQKRLEQELNHAQKMNAIGTLAGGIAHDFNNLLTGIQGNASLMLLGCNEDHIHYENLKHIEEYVKRGAELTRHLLGFSLSGKYEVRPTNLNDLVEKSSKMFGRTKKEITIHRCLQNGIWPVEVDQGQIEQVLLNMYVNAWHAMPDGGDLYLHTENTFLDENMIRPFGLKAGKYVRIAITDTGIGMDEATRLRVFDPFFTTKGMGKGTGLGLASAYGIIKNHGGLIKVESEPGRGTTFTFYLPVSKKSFSKEAPLLSKIYPGKETILMVDDEEMIIETARKLLQRIGYKVILEKSGQAAVHLYKEQNMKIDIVILDMIMPGMGGAEIYKQIKKINPAVKVLLSSGYSLNSQVFFLLKKGCQGFIQKPFNIQNLSRKIREILD